MRGKNDLRFVFHRIHGKMQIAGSIPHYSYLAVTHSVFICTMHSHLDKNHHSQESGNHQLESEGGQSLNPPAFQLKADSGDPPADSPPGRQNNTGLPDELKAGVESLSGYSMDDVQVHYNSSKPGQMKAHAFAQGSEIHVAPGQEKHLPHEAWHVAQQKQGRVQPTKAMNGAPVNDDSSLEQEADQMGARAAQPMQYKASAELNQAMSGASGVAQLYEDQFAIEKTALDEGKARDIQKGILDIYEAHTRPAKRTSGKRWTIALPKKPRWWAPNRTI
jgi:hypothetical protein